MYCTATFTEKKLHDSNLGWWARPSDERGKNLALGNRPTKSNEDDVRIQSTTEDQLKQR